MISHKAKLFLSLASLLWFDLAKGEIVRDCDLIKQAKMVGAINPQLVLAIANVESSKNGKARNGNHYGMMQLKLGTAKMLGFKGNPKALLDWKLNVKFGSQYLNDHLDHYKSVKDAIAAYNAGTVFLCKKKCKRGSYTNQNYVDKVMYEYSKIKASHC